MEQTLLSLFAGESAALLPGLTPPDGGARAVAGGMPFSDLLHAAAANADLPREAQDALLVEMIAQSPLNELPALLQGLGFALPEGMAATPLDDGNVSPLGGNPLPAALQQLLHARFGVLPHAGDPPVRQVALSPAVPAQTASELVGDPEFPTLPVAAEIDDVAPLAPSGAAGADVALAAEPMLDPMIQRLIESRTMRGKDAPRAAASTTMSGQDAVDPMGRVLSDLARILVPARGTEAPERDANPDLTAALRRDLGGGKAGAEAVPLAATAGVPGAFESTLAAARTPRGEFSLPQAPTHAGWPDAFAERVTFAVTQQLQQAELRLNPPQLGQIELRISLVQDQASVSFSSQHIAVREAIEAALPRLRESLADAGLTLVNVDVSDRSLAQDRRWAEPDRTPYPAPQVLAEFELSPEAPAVYGGGDGHRIDYFV